MEGSEGRTVDIKDANKREITRDDSKYSVLPSGKSIIEEWRNPPKYSEDLLRSDRVYEERAVDVVIDHRSQNVPKKLLLSAPPFTNNEVNLNDNDDKLLTIKRPQGGGTVRSIPIKDYQASIAHNIGTLRRSMVPQSQFESLVSEPEKNTYASSKRRLPVINDSHHRATSQITCSASQIETGNAPKKLFCYFCENHHGQRDCYCADLNNATDKNGESDRYFSRLEDQRSQDGSDIDEYFRRSSRDGLSTNENCQRAVSKQAREFVRKNAGALTTADTTDEKVKGQRSTKDTEMLRLEEGHVGQKISAFEQNAHRSLRAANPRHRSVFEVKGHRTIGVPLVGMHNACGLPVVASWHDHELLEPLRISRRIGSVYKSPRALRNARRRTQLKRKAPQPTDHAMINARDVERAVKRSTIKSVAHLDTINGGLSRRRHRRSSFTTTKLGSLSSKNSFKKTARSKRHGIRARSLVDTFGRKSMNGGSAKRTTLYAKDDGEEAVQVLKSLCLNPLARTNPETEMMW